MNRIRVLVASLPLALAPVAVAAPAQAVGSQDGCRYYEFVAHNNDWNFFWNHKIRLHARACIKMGSTRYQNYAYLKWVGTPSLSLLSRGRISAEHVSIEQKPELLNVNRTYRNRMSSVSYSFALKSCNLAAPWLCQDWLYTFRVSTLGTRICVENGKGRCDDKKYW